MGSQRTTRIDKLFDEDTLILIEGLARDGYTNQDIALRLGIDPSVLYNAKRTRPEINAAINRGKQIVDYKVENALLKAALGYTTKEIKVTIEEVSYDYEKMLSDIEKNEYISQKLISMIREGL